MHYAYISAWLSYNRLERENRVQNHFCQSQTFTDSDEHFQWKAVTDALMASGKEYFISRGGQSCPPQSMQWTEYQIDRTFLIPVEIRIRQPS